MVVISQMEEKKKRKGEVELSGNRMIYEIKNYRLPALILLGSEH